MEVAGTFMLTSFGWAAGDVSLAACIQVSLARAESEHRNVPALRAVIAFWYSNYVLIYAICSPLLGKYIDGVYDRAERSDDTGTVLNEHYVTLPAPNSQSDRSWCWL